MSKKVKSDQKTASVLAFERKLDPSDALMFGCAWDARTKQSQWSAIQVREKSVRGTISNRLKAGDLDPAKLDAKIQNPNLQTVDIASLNADHDTLVVRWTLRVLGGVGEPSACNDEGYRQLLVAKVQEYVDGEGLDVLAQRYATNLANGRFVWRNRVGAEQVEVKVRRLENGATAQEWTFDGMAISTRSFENPSAEINSLAKVLNDGLRGRGHVLLEVTAFVRIGAGQEVYPSQELILDKGKDKKSKTLYSVEGVAAMHSQKIGNALRTIDDWYPADEEGLRPYGPIAVEPYGSVTTLGSAFRQPKQKKDFYTLLDNWVLRDNVPAKEDQHFVMAVLVRGGVFGEQG